MTDIDAIGRLLCTPARRKIWAALRRGREIYITPDSRAVDRQTGEVYGNQIAALEILFAGYARWRPGCEWIVEWHKRSVAMEAHDAE